VAAELVIDGIQIKAGSTHEIHLPVAKLYNDTDISIPIYVNRAKKQGPTFFICAAIHGDELNGIEIIRRLIKKRNFKLLKGTLIAVPMVNVHGVLNQSRYMPDRRDLNRCFPGTAKGSMAGRVAHKFFSEIVMKCDYGIDLHTGAIHRGNLPQIRADLSDQETLDLARAFNVPVLLDSDLRDGSLRQVARENDVRILVYEAGEALRFDELSIRAGLKGVLNVMSFLGMRKTRQLKVTTDPFIATKSIWLRATASGIVNNRYGLGMHVKKGDVLAEIGDSFGEVLDKVIVHIDGVIIGMQNIPLVQEGDAMFHIAHFTDASEVAENIEQLQDDLFVD